MIGRRVAVGMVLGALALACLPGVASGGDQKVYGVQDCGEPKVEPKRIVFACADFGLYANHFDWRNWGHRKAHATGVLHAKVCDPDCAGGDVKDYPVEITLHKIKTWSCNGLRARFYRKIKMSFPGPRPPGVGPYVHSAFVCF